MTASTTLFVGKVVLGLLGSLLMAGGFVAGVYESVEGNPVGLVVIPATIWFGFEFVWKDQVEMSRRCEELRALEELERRDGSR